MATHDPVDARLIQAMALLAGLVMPGAARADCGLVPFSVAQPVVERFVMNRQTLLRELPDGGEALETRVALIAGSSRAALSPLLAVARLGNQRQKEAIAIGLARAAKGCEAKDRQATRRIEAAVRAAPDAALVRQFQTAFRNPAAQSSVPAEAATPPTPAPTGSGSLGQSVRSNPGPIRTLPPVQGVGPVR